MISRNRFHVEDLLLGKTSGKKSRNRENKILRSMTTRDRQRLQQLKNMRVGRKALQKHKQFTGIPLPTRIDELNDGRRKKTALVVMGTEPFVLVADGPKDRHSKLRKYRGKWVATTTPNGKKIIILKNGKAGKGFGKGLKFIGWIPETHYVLNKRVENAGSFKRGRYWIHKNGEDGGSWPRGFVDNSGNIHYKGGTYRVGKWIIN
jgi:hypothetical protein